MNSNFSNSNSTFMYVHTCMYVVCVHMCTVTVTDTRRGTAVRRKKNIFILYTTLLVLMCDWYYTLRYLCAHRFINMHLRYIEPSTPVCTRRCTTPYTRVHPVVKKSQTHQNSRESQSNKFPVLNVFLGSMDFFIAFIIANAAEPWWVSNHLVRCLPIP